MFVAIDPDTKGGAAFFDHKWNPHLLVSWVDFKNNVAWREHLKTRIQVYRPEYAILETASSRPGQNSRATFTHGGFYRSIKDLLIDAGVKVVDMRPQEWQQKAGVYGLNRAEPDAGKRRRLNKKLFKTKALELYPELPLNAEGLYDAVLIGVAGL
jgi:hypothetical protein